MKFGFIAKHLPPRFLGLFEYAQGIHRASIA
jgi:hypothetical protein